MKPSENIVTFNELKWDSDFFGIKSAKVLLHRSLTKNEWENIKVKFCDYQFITIVNQNSDPVNAQLISKDTLSFLADINIQFEKKIIKTNEMPRNVTAYQSLERDDRIIEIADFQHSRFLFDPELAKRGGKYVYQEWIINSFGKPEKYYMLSKDEKGIINGFVLCSYFKKTCVIELISVSKEVSKCGIGTSLFKAVEYTAYQRDCNTIKVGTQLKNLSAINFYHKVGCKQVECHEIYHLWGKLDDNLIKPRDINE